MIDFRLLASLPKARLGILASVVARWFTLLCHVVLFAWLGAFVGSAISGTSANAGTFGFLLSGGIAVPVVCVVLIAVLCTMAQWCANHAGSVASATLGQLIFTQVVELGSHRTQVLDDSEVVTLIGEGLELLRPYFSSYVPQFIYGVLAPVTLFFMVAGFDLPVAIVFLVCVPLMPASIMLLMIRAKRFLGEYWGTYVDLGGAFLDAIRGLTTLKVFGTDKRAHLKLDEQAEEFRHITMKLLRTQLQSVTFMDLFTYGGIAVGCAVTCWQVALGDLGLADAVTIVLLSSSFFLPMRTFGSYFHTGMNAKPVIAQIHRLLDAEAPVEGDRKIEGSQITIEAHGLAFSYGSQHKSAESSGIEKEQVAYSSHQLEAIDFTVRPNSFIGIAGPSGSGKSTLAGLLSGNLSGYEGTFLINGIELRDATTKSIHETVTLVSRESHVFRGTFRSNLTVAAPEAGDGVLWDVLRRARLAEFVYECGGLDASVEADGANLSGGQRQRLVFARALLRNTPVYVFDEATANIDADSERYLLAAIQKIALSKTVIVISHRLPLLRHADEILVLSKGRIAERGTHRELLDANGMYRTMWDRTADLEAFAESLAGELPEEEPDPVEEALASMPGMMAGVMRAFLGIMEAQRYQGGASDGVPKGHPAWIPLPHYRAGISNEKAEELEQDASPEAEEPTMAMPGFMGLANATAEGAENEAIKAAMAQLRDHMQRPEPVRVVVEPLPPAHRSTFTIVRKCLELTSGMVPRIALAMTLGCLGWLLTCGVFVLFAAGMVLASGVAGTASTFSGLSPIACVVAASICALLRGPIHYAERLLTHDCTFATVSTIRSRVFGVLRQLAPAKVEARDAGDLISLLTSDIEILEGFYSRALVPIASAVLAAAICVVVAAVANPVCAVVIAVFYLVVGGFLPAMALRATRERGAELRAYAVLMTGFLLDALRGMGDLLTFGRAQEYADELGERLESLSSGEGDYARLVAVLSVLPQVASLIGVVVLAFVCVQQISCGALQVLPALLLVVGYVASVEAMTTIAGLGTSFGQVLAAADRVLDVMEEEPAVREVPHPVALNSFGGLRFEGVTFGYHEGMTAVDDATFQIEPGTFVAITGESGVGKTTMLKLAMRFWDVDEGTVRMGDVDVRQARLSDVRQQVSYMVQDTYLFEGTLRENLLVAKEDATDEQIEAALDKAALLDAVRLWPKGLDTKIGVSAAQEADGLAEETSGSIGVSDGERQRIGLARAFLHDAPLFLLDEPTSNLDALNEAAVLRSLCLYAQDKTVAIVSHRRAVTAIVDKLLVVE